jgi:hypothetical protein
MYVNVYNAGVVTYGRCLLSNLQLCTYVQLHRCSRLDRFSKVEETNFVFNNALLYS